jgi:hypothetical protein
LDTDQSGGLDARELVDGLLARGYRVSREEMDQLIDRMDLNQDGTIAFDEFSSALVDWQKVRVHNLSLRLVLTSCCLHSENIMMTQSGHTVVLSLKTSPLLRAATE